MNTTDERRRKVVFVIFLVASILFAVCWLIATTAFGWGTAAGGVAAIPICALAIYRIVTIDRRRRETRSPK